MNPTTPVDTFMKNAFPEMFDRRERGDCPFCGNPIDPEDFHDEMSRREFEISGICQCCQDGFFDG